MTGARKFLCGLAGALLLAGAASGAAAAPVVAPPGLGTAFRLAAAERPGSGEAALIPVQGCGTDCPPPAYTHDGPDPSPGPVGLSSSNTDAIVDLIAEANTTCGALILKKRKAYRIDCLRWYYRRIAETIPDNSDYRPIREALERAADRLDAIVRKYRDREADRIAPRIRNQPLAPRMDPIRAVAEANEPRAAREAAKVVEETKIVILRSGEDPTRRTAHYREIASAVDANLVILRSA